MKKVNPKMYDIIGIAAGILLLVVCILSVVINNQPSVAGAAEIPDTAVTAEGTAQGRNGPITVSVTADENAIYQIEVLEQEETEGIGSVAVTEMPSRIFQTQSLQAEAVSGATITSDALVEAVRNALTNAGLDPTVFDVEAVLNVEPEPDEELSCDVVIVGAGGAGMTAAIEAHDAGANVIVVESTAMVGGNSVRSTGGLNAADTEYQNQNEFGEAAGVEKQLEAAKSYPDDARIQELAGIVAQQWADYQANPDGYFDSVELFQLDTLIGGKALNDTALVETLAENSADAIDWLKGIGADMPSVSSFGGASVKRIHRPLNAEGKVVPVGEFVVPILEQNLADRGVEVRLNTPAQEILMDNGAAVGVVCKGPTGNTVTIHAKAVVLATGGFGANHEMVESYQPSLKGFMSTNASGIQGQGIAMAQAVGADTVDMDQIQIHPTVQADTAALITEGLRGDGAILVNQEGKRFYDEVSTRDKVSAAEIAQTGSASWLIVDGKMAEASSVIQGYIKQGITVTGDTPEALAEAMGIDPAAFAETLKTWNGYVEQKNDPDFGRTSFAEPLDTAPYYAIHVTAGVHHTMGGVKINTNAEVIDTNGSVIPGLFAAGEVTGGVHGGNRLGGNAVADFVIFGRIAGTSAAEYIGAAELDQAA